MSKPSNGSRLLLAVLAALGLSARAPELHANPSDPRVPLRIVTARPAPHGEFGAQAKLVWQARVLEPLLAAPVADGNSLVIAHASGLVVELDSNLHRGESVRPAPPADNRYAPRRGERAPYPQNDYRAAPPLEEP